jgi:hypothetical protein
MVAVQRSEKHLKNWNISNEVQLTIVLTGTSNFNKEFLVEIS